MTIPAGEQIFLDTNILLSACDLTRPTHEASLKLVTDANNYGHHPVISRQVFREFLVVATRPPGNNGLGLSALEAFENVSEFRRFCVVLDPHPSEWTHLERLVIASKIRGKRIHDANIVATMISHGLAWLITDNSTDFKDLFDINVLTSSEYAELLQ